MKELRDGCLPHPLRRSVRREFKEKKHDRNAARDRNGRAAVSSSIKVIVFVLGGHMTGLSINICGLVSLLTPWADAFKSCESNKENKREPRFRFQLRQNITSLLIKHSGFYSCSVQVEQLPAPLAWAGTATYPFKQKVFLTLVDLYDFLLCHLDVVFMFSGGVGWVVQCSCVSDHHQKVMHGWWEQFVHRICHQDRSHIRHSHQLALAPISRAAAAAAAVAEQWCLSRVPLSFSPLAVVGHHRHGRHSRDGRSSWIDHGPTGWSLAARQHLHLAESRQQAAKRPAHLPASASGPPRPAAQPQRCLHSLGLGGRSWERREDVHPQGGGTSEAVIYSDRDRRQDTLPKYQKCDSKGVTGETFKTLCQEQPKIILRWKCSPLDLHQMIYIPRRAPHVLIFQPMFELMRASCSQSF